MTAHVSYLLATSLYESYIPQLGGARNSGKVSGFGFAIGFLGGVAAIIAVRPLAASGTASGNIEDYRLAFLVIAAMFLFLSLPALWGLKGVAADWQFDRPSLGAWQTLRNWRDQPEVFKMLLASYLINNGLVTIAYFSANFLSTHFGTSVERLLLFLLIYHMIAIPTTFAFGVLADLWSHRNSIILSLIIWIAALLLMAFGSASWVPITVVCLIATAFGGTQSMLRSMLSTMVPIDRTAEFFGFNTLAGRLSATAGPLTYGLVARMSGSDRVALLCILAFVIAGIVVLTRVRAQ